ncbi:hypothetical protein NBRC110019_03040 [Neptunitalea chrysea]|uniref:Gylcosyl hydrolase 115 C-terminal domain-containing protein n=1 Tax=Neptunitalea chrysea TaxID=1647581 RepID=A0A9W6B305_9FLAO|nr:glycosyl hydrolase 115 family protein [Neptunitalea chrysea]GLB51265.1 hypothetical protein NBRC110019_03040 [Neptunitalea chrysea]
MSLYLEAQNHDSTFSLYKRKTVCNIVYDDKGSSLDSIVAYLLADDINLTTGVQPNVRIYNGEKALDTCILIGNLNSEFIQFFLNDTLENDFIRQRESYFKGVRASNYIIAGTDTRGTAYGVFSLSEEIGINPWCWWTDVLVQKQDSITIIQPDYYSKEPSITYRGIFLNDEDWGLQPWAAKTFEKETGDIGPKTYAKIFELLLRLKANTIWPAMHPSTKAFFHYSDNPKMAEQYHILIGSSHAEPMLRNNVDEWDSSLGRFDYKTNKETVFNYWEQRVKQAQNIEGIYTMGMRGIHDSGMEGVKTIKEGAEVLNSVISDQRMLLSKYHTDTIANIPQAFTVYKEVLKLYDYGIELPEDITIVWTDDNYGYIRRLSDLEEQQRAGGAGVYYHISYWGRPHDYLWLSTTPPYLIAEEMLKAYQMNARKMWILNVGDIKPAAYDIQLFMDMAYNPKSFFEDGYTKEHQSNFFKKIFGEKIGDEITKIKDTYYHLAYERKPEYMGWSQTEPTTQVNATAYNPYNFGDEVQHRLAAYNQLASRSDNLFKIIPNNLKDAYFQMVHYSVKGAMFMNQKQLYRDLAEKYNKAGRLEAYHYKNKSIASYDSIVALTNQFNTEISNGKWNGIMSMSPRNLPVFQKPTIDLIEASDFDIGGYQIEGNHNEGTIMPTFYKGFNDSYYIDVFLKNEGQLTWSLKHVPRYLKVSKKSGVLNSNRKDYSERIWLEIDWSITNKSILKKDSFILRLGDRKIPISIKKSEYSDVDCKECFFEKNGFAVAYASSFKDATIANGLAWNVLDGLGYSGKVVQAGSFNKSPLDSISIEQNHPKLSYTFYTETIDTSKIIIAALPTHPLTKHHKVRIGVQWDNTPVQIVNFETYGRSNEWKENVLRNLAIREVPVAIKAKGKHQLNIYMIDEGVALDFIYLKTSNTDTPYSLLEETNFFNK